MLPEWLGRKSRSLDNIVAVRVTRGEKHGASEHNIIVSANTRLKKLRVARKCYCYHGLGYAVGIGGRFKALAITAKLFWVTF
jgi:hypothetical protein